MSALDYRPAKESDFALISSGFLAGYRSAHAAGMILMDDWDEVMGLQWNKILDRDGVDAFVAYKPSEDDTRFDLYGFIVIDSNYTSDGKSLPFVVYCNVKHKYRRLGVATGLLKIAGVDPAKEFHYAAKTGVVSKLREQIPLAKWKPLAIRFEGNNE